MYINRRSGVSKIIKVHLKKSLSYLLYSMFNKNYTFQNEINIKVCLNLVHLNRASS